MSKKSVKMLIQLLIFTLKPGSQNVTGPSKISIKLSLASGEQKHDPNAPSRISVLCSYELSLVSSL
jgi:hypothetical protein